MGLIKDAWDIVKEKAEWKEMQTLAKKVPDLEKRIATIEKGLSGNPNGEACDNCGSINVKRTGARPHPKFGSRGVKEILFTCLDCGSESSVMGDLPK